MSATSPSHRKHALSLFSAAPVCGLRGIAFTRYHQQVSKCVPSSQSSAHLHEVSSLCSRKLGLQKRSFASVSLLPPLRTLELGLTPPGPGHPRGHAGPPKPTRHPRHRLCNGQKGHFRGICSRNKQISCVFAASIAVDLDGPVLLCVLSGP